MQWHLGHVGLRQSDRGRRRTPYPCGCTSTIWARPPGPVARSSREAPSDSGQVEWTHRPGAAHSSGRARRLRLPHEYPDERGIIDRDDVVHFTLAASERPLDLAGPIDLHVALRSSAPTTHLFAKLYDVDPEGSCRLIVRGQAELLDTSGKRLLRIELGTPGIECAPDIGYASLCSAATSRSSSLTPERTRTPGSRSPPSRASRPCSARLESSPTWSSRCSRSMSDTADLVVTGGPIVTLDHERPAAEAVLIRDGRIELVGDLRTVRTAAREAEVLDLAGATALPGFVDAHSHIELSSISLECLISAHAPPCRSLREVAAVIDEQKVSQTSSPW